MITYLGTRTMRFGEPDKLLPGTSRKVLVEQLKELENDGIITRRVFAEVPARVEYSLTIEGQALLPIFGQLRAWGTNQVETLKARGQSSADTNER